MIYRCYNEKNATYPYYGGRGITVCDEWRNNSQSFVDWAYANGFKPELTLDRIDTDGPYSPENCRWTTWIQQSRNRRNAVTNLEKGTRICYNCKVEKSFSAFGIHRTSPSGYGHRYMCKNCRRETNT